MTFHTPDEQQSKLEQQQASTLLNGRAQLLARGATCTVYTNGSHVVRISNPNPHKAARFQVDAQVRRKLRALGVPTPVTEETGTLPDGRAYSVDTLIRGDDSAPTASGWQQLSASIHALHRLECHGSGLLEDRADELRGGAATAAEGFLSRLPKAWPFAGGSLSAQPLLWQAPNLQQPLQLLESELLGLTHLPVCVCHTDLHQNQWVWQNGELAALLDFGDASVGPPAWDWASLAYFLGWERATMLADAELGREVALFGLLLAFHRAQRGTSENRPSWQQDAAKFAHTCLARLGALPAQIDSVAGFTKHP